MSERRFKIYKLKFHGPLHLSKGKEDYDESADILHSDTLKSAIFVSALQLFGKEVLGDNEGKSFFESFKVSSAFPFCAGEFFFPKPYARIQDIAGVNPENESKQSKTLKKIAFIGKSYFEDLLNGAQRQINENHILNGGEYLSDNSSLITINKSGKKELLPIVVSEVNQRVTIPREYGIDSTPFYMERIFFGEQSGLFFIIDINDNSELENKIDASMKLLGENGIGTDKSVGNGNFVFFKEEITIKVPDNTNHQFNLSLFCPEKQELSESMLETSSYQLLKRGGFIANPSNIHNSTLRKRSVHMFGEGSIFSTPQKLEGKVVNLKPKTDQIKHPVWRDGRAIFLPILPKPE